MRWQHYPRLLGRSENMDVRRQPVGLVESADAHEADRIAASAIVAPQRDAALRTTADALALAAVRRRIDDFDAALQQLHSIAFQQRIQRERGAGLALAPAAVTTMHEH